MKEKLFSFVSLGFLTVGFIVGVAGADKDGPKDLAHATDQLIQHVTLAKEAEEINQTPTIVTLPIDDKSKSDSPDQKIVLATEKNKENPKN